MTPEEKIERKRETTRRWQIANREKLLKYHRDFNKKYYAKNKKTLIEASLLRYKNNRENILLRMKIKYKENPRKYLTRNWLYRQANQKKIRNMDRLRHKKQMLNVRFKFNSYLRSRVLAALRGRYKTGSAVSLLGCSVDEALSHIESQFQLGMTWKNWARKGWHIDHKRPLSSFDLTIPEQMAQACHYTNLQPLWWQDNLSKGSKK